MTAFIPQPDNRPEVLRGLQLRSPHDEPEPYYYQKELNRPGTEEHVLLEDRCYAYTRTEGATLHYAIMLANGSDGEDMHMECLWAGEGVSSNLRELRHSYFGNQHKGYISYIDLAAMEAATSLVGFVSRKDW